MNDLTQRQKEILSAIVEEYAEVASPVGSVTLAKLFSVSSATIRNEMGVLEREGLIKQPHTSAGRIPTDKGYRLYVNDINDGSNKKAAKSTKITAADRGSKAIETRIQGAGNADRAIRSAVKTLVDLTDNIALGTIGDSLYIQGYASLFSKPELATGRAAHEVARLLDNLEPWLRETAPNEPLSVYIGKENPIGKTSGCTLIISRFCSPYSDNSYVGVLGTTRQDYRTVMRLVKHTGKALEEALA